MHYYNNNNNNARISDALFDMKPNYKYTEDDV